MPSSTRLHIRQALQLALEDGGFSYTVASATANTITISALISGATNISSARYNGAYWSITSGAAIGQSRKVRTDGYAKATGAFTVDPAWTSIPAPGVTAELTWLFPAEAQNATDDAYNPLINRGLSRLSIPDSVAAANSGTYQIDLATWPWLDRPERLREVREPGPISSGRLISAEWRDIKRVFDGGSARLELGRALEPLHTGLLLDVMRPANTWVNGAESTTGMTTDTDTVAVSIEDAVTVILPECYQALAARGRSGFEKKWATAREIARALKYYDAGLERRVEAAPGRESASILQPLPGAA